MSDTGGKGLRALAQEYYKGELSYESYRSERTQLLDRITDRAADDETSASNTRAMPKKTKVMWAANYKQAPSLRRHHRLWILLMVLMATVVLIWAESLNG